MRPDSRTCASRRVAIVVSVAALAALVAGCSDSPKEVSSVPQTSARSSTTATTSTTTTTIPPLPPTTALRGTAQQLRERLAMHGICVTEIEPQPYEGVPITSAVSCDDGYGILVFPTVETRDQGIELISSSLCFVPYYLAVSDDWIVYPQPATALRAGRVIDRLGGEVREVPCTYVPPELDE